MDPHKILDLGKNATLEEIQRAYRAKAMKYHPDQGGDAWAFQQVQAAYEQLASGLDSRPLSSAAQPSHAAATPVNKGRSAHDASSFKPRAGNGPQVQDHSPATPLTRWGWQHAAKKVRYFFNRIRRAGHQQLPLQDDTTIFILINVLDIIVTFLVLWCDGVEANPVARFFLQFGGFKGVIFFKMVSVAFVCVVAQVIAVRNLRAAQWLLRFGTLVVGIVVLWGLLLLLPQLGAI